MDILCLPSEWGSDCVNVAKIPSVELRYTQIAFSQFSVFSERKAVIFLTGTHADPNVGVSVLMAFVLNELSLGLLGIRSVPASVQTFAAFASFRGLGCMAPSGCTSILILVGASCHLGASAALPRLRSGGADWSLNQTPS